MKLYYDRAQYALEWVFNGGTASNDYTGRGGAYEIYYDTALILPEPAKRGHDFGGWFDNETFNESGKLAAGAKMPAASQTYYAKWSPSVYGITYGNMVNGTFAAAQPEKHTYGTATEIPNLTRTGYVFNGWVVNGEGAAQTGLTLDAEDYIADITLTAQWTAERYAITYEGMDGAQSGSSQPTEYVYDKDAVISDPTKAGYTFLGWVVNGTGEAQRNLTLAKESYTGAITLKATWKQNPYAITWVVNESGTINETPEYSKTAFLGGAITAPTVTAKDGYAFGGWYTDRKFTESSKFTDGETMPNHDVTFYAKWTAIQYEITYVLDGGTNVSGNPAQYTVETEKIALVAPTKTGYAFEGWYSDNTYSTKVTEIATGSVGDVTLYAKWTINQYTITWETNGGNALTGNYTTKADYGTSIVLPDTPTKNQTVSTTHTFAGWYTDVACTHPLEDGAIVPENGMMLYAKWNETARKYTITWVSEGADNKTTELVYGARLGMNTPSDIQRDAEEGYTWEIEGWYTQPDGAGQKIDGSTTVTGDATYYAKWEQVWKYYTVSFDLGGVATIPPQRVKHGEKAVEPTLPEVAKNYGELFGWLFGSIWFSFDTKVTCDLTLTAKWSTLYGYDTTSLKNAVANTAAGGTVKITSDITLSESILLEKNITIDGNTKTITSGSGVFRVWTDNDNADITVKNLTLKASGQNRAINVYKVHTLTLDNVTISGFDSTAESSEKRGGAILVQKGYVICKNCTFTGNKAVDGGAIAVVLDNVYSEADATCTGCIFTDNSAVTGNGGAVYVINTKGTSTFTNCTFTNNTAPNRNSGGYGGALYVGGNGGARVILDGCSFSGNRANGNNGATNGDHVWVTSKQGTYSYLEIRNTKDSSKFPNGEHKGGFFSEVYGIER